MSEALLFAESLKKINWDVQDFNAYPFYIVSAAKLSGFNLPWGVHYRHFLTIFHDERAQWHYDAEDYLRVGRAFWNNIRTVEDFLKLRDEYRKKYAATIKQAFYDPEKLQTLSASDILDVLKRQVERLAASGGIAHSIEGASFVAEAYLKENYTKDNMPLIEAVEKSFLKKAELFAFDLLQSGKNDEDVLRIFCQKYPWIKSTYLGTKEVTVTDVKDLALKISAHDEEKCHDASVDNQYVSILPYLVSWQDERKANILESIHAVHPVLSELSRQYNMPHRHLAFLLPGEVDKLSDPEFRKELVARTEYLIEYATQTGEVTVLTGEVGKVFAENFQIKDDSGRDNLSGMVAYRGIVRGVVRVCLSVASLADFQEGEILVASMTRPEYISAMKRAAAIVTDEGGITCHAAIVAREMKKPCIIGTKIATKVLKDGDVVEVDADNGLVRKL